MDMQKLLRQAHDMQDRMQRELGETFAEASVGGGMVRAKVDGHKHLVELEVDPAAVDPDDVSMLQDLVIAAVNEANRQIDEALREKMAGFAGGLRGMG